MALTDSLVAYWSLQSDGTDATGRGNTLTNSGASFVAGKVGNGADCEQTEADYLYRASTTDLQTGNIDWSIALWMKHESQATVDSLAGKAGATQPDQEYVIWVQANPAKQVRFRWYTNDAGASVTVDDTAVVIGTGAWYFVVAYHDATANKIGVSVNGNAATTADATGGNAGAANFRLGSGYGSTETNYTFDGLIDEVGIWKRVLTADERTALYNGGSGLAYPFTTGNPLGLFAAQMRQMQAYGGVAVG